MGTSGYRRLGGLRSKMPWTYATFFAAALAIAGFPLLSGFFSKDEILTSAFESGHTILWGIGLVTAGLTAFYIFRAFFLTFHTEPRWEADEGPLRATKDEDHSSSVARSGPSSVHSQSSVHPHESPSVMTAPLAVLAVLSVVAGSVGMPAVMGPNFLEGYFEPVFGESTMHIAPGTEWALIGASVLAGLLGIAVAYWFYVANPAIPGALAERFDVVYKLLWNKYYVDEIYSTLFVEPGRRFAMFLWETVDVQVIDGTANGLARAVGAISRVLRGLQAGYARAYALAMLVGTVVIIGWLILK